MNIRDKHMIDLPISEVSLFEGQVGITSSFHIIEEGQLNNQMLQVPVLLICIEGKLIFQEKKGERKTLISGDFLNIKPMIEYNFRGLTDSQILLIK